ncbi:MAG: thymidylate synthase [Chloroflexota bacterium]
MNLVFIEANTLSEAWFLAVRKLFEAGTKYKIDRGSYKGQYRLEFDYFTLHVKYPGTLPMVPDVPAGIPAPCTMEYVESYLPYLLTGEKHKNEEYTYGQYLDPQIKKVIAMYKNDGCNTNQAFMAVGDASSIDLPDPPCLRGIDTRIRDGKLNFIVYFRSWDLWGGLPGNLAGIELVKQYMASEIGVENGEIIAASKGLHLYDHSWEIAKRAVRL